MSEPDLAELGREPSLDDTVVSFSVPLFLVLDVHEVEVLQVDVSAASLEGTGWLDIDYRTLDVVGESFVDQRTAHVNLCARLCRWLFSTACEVTYDAKCPYLKLRKLRYLALVITHVVFVNPVEEERPLVPWEGFGLYVFVVACGHLFHCTTVLLI